jgi:hypothetical protein
MLTRFPKITYSKLTARQKENYNFQKVSAVLADHGFSTIRLSDDWNGADFIAQHLSGETLKVQLKSRLTFCSKYQGRDLWVAFPGKNGWYLYPHDELLQQLSTHTQFTASNSWVTGGEYTWPSVPNSLLPDLLPYFFRV